MRLQRVPIPHLLVDLDKIPEPFGSAVVVGKKVSHACASVLETNPMRGKQIGSKGPRFPQQTEQQMLGPDVLMTEALSFFRGVGEDTLGLVTDRHVHGS